jgi:hypothetical protein
MEPLSGLGFYDREWWALFTGGCPLNPTFHIRCLCLKPASRLNQKTMALSLDESMRAKNKKRGDSPSNIVNYQLSIANS